MNHESIAKIAAGVQRENPLPAKFADLDKLSRRIIERKAAALGRDPERYYADLVRERAEQLDSADKVAEIVKKARRYGRS